MSDFKAKMQQIRFRLGLRPRPRWGTYSAPPYPLTGFKGPTSKGREGGKGYGRGGKEGEGRGRGEMDRGLIGLDPVPLLSFADLRPWQ